MVEKEKLMQVFESARLAPSGGNTQPWNYIIVESNETKDKIVGVDHNQQWMINAPIFIVCVADIRCRIDSNKVVFVDEKGSEPELKQIIKKAP